MLSLQDISDRLEIQDLLTDYCYAIDEKNFDALDDIFIPDAEIDYTETGGAKGNLAEIKNYLPRALEQFENSQHMIATTKLNITGDTATAKSICFNPMNPKRDAEPVTFFVGLWYVDELVRTAQGWRISKRHEALSYFHNLPADFAAVDPDAS